MDALTCSIHALIACFNLSNFYVHGALRYEDIDYCERDMATNRCVVYSANPLGDIGIGFRADVSRQLSIDLRMFGHSSMLRSNGDRGVNYAMLSVDWHPFRR